mgnify:CR=1 FL=1
MKTEVLYNQLTNWGADVSKARERLLEDDELYVSCLIKFAEDENFALLDSCMEKGDLKGAFDHAHAIKGVAGNLGLTPLFNAASQLVEPLRNGAAQSLGCKLEEVMRLKDEFTQIVGE